MIIIITHKLLGNLIEGHKHQLTFFLMSYLL